MERLMFVMKLHHGQIEEYEKRHEAVWPELLGDLWNAGWRNYSLFRRDHEIFAYAECHPSIADALGAMRHSKANQDWAEWFSTVIASILDSDGNLFRADEVWHMDDQIAEKSARANPADPPNR